MTYEYLEMTASAIADASGVARASIGPTDTQWWAPTYIRVSTAQSIESECTVYLGPPNILDASTYLDDTVIGNNDMSSIIAGQIVQTPSKITALWDGLFPGTPAILTVYGRRSNLPPSQGEVLPEVPGTRFSGHSTLIPNSKPLFFRVDPDIDGDEFIGTFFVGDTPHLGIRFEAFVGNFRVRFAYGPVAGPGNATSTPFDVSVRAGSTFDQSIPVLGPWVEVNVFTVGPNASYQVSVWAVPEPYKRTTFENGYGVIFNLTGESVAAGVTETHQGSWVTPGLAHWSAITSAAVNAVAIDSIDRGGTVRILDRSNNITAMPARLIFLPATDIQVRIFNGDAAARTFDVSVVMRPIQSGQ